MKKIAVPITSNNEIEYHFGRCKFYEIYTLSNTNEIVEVQSLESDGGCGCKSTIANVLTNHGVTYMLAGNIGNKAMNTLNDAGITVIRGCSGNSSAVILQFVKGEIADGGSSCLVHKEHRSEGHKCNH